LRLAGAIPVGYGQSTNVALEDGIRALQAGQFAQARRILSKVVKRSPSAENISYLAMAEAGTGDLGRAIADFQQSIRLGNHSAGVHYNLGIAYLKSGRPEDGIRELRLALARDPEFEPPMHALGIALLDVGRPNEAVPYLEQARTLSPRDSEVWAKLVRAQFELGNSSAALKTIDQAVRAIPGNTRLLVTLADLSLQHGQAQKARSMLEGANEAQPRDASIELSLARACLQAREPKEALAVLKDVPPEAGRPGETMFLRGEAQALTENFVVAEVDLSAAVEADPQNVEYLIAYAWLKQLETQYEEALEILDRARKLDAQLPAIPYRVAVNYFSLGKFPETIKACQEAIQLAPGYAEAYMIMGVAELQKKDFSAAEVAFRHAVTLKPNTEQFHLLLGVALYKNDKFEESYEELNQTLILDSQSAYAYFYRAQVLAHSGERRKAIADLETAVSLQPHYRKAYAELARLYAADGQREKAVATLAKERAEVHREEDENARLLQEAGALP
jgi:tetratricopeptide (TPR) repeat protein